MREIAWTFFVLGTTAWGGLYAQLPRMEEVFIEKKRWLTQTEFFELLAVAALVPGPTFLALAGLLGHRLRGWVGGAVAIIALILPAFVLVVLGLILVPPARLSGSLQGMTRALSLAVSGILLGGAIRLGLRGDDWRRGVPLAGAILAALFFGLHPALAVLVGLLAGGWWVRPGPAAQP